MRVGTIFLPTVENLQKVKSISLSSEELAGHVCPVELSHAMAPQPTPRRLYEYFYEGFCYLYVKRQNCLKAIRFVVKASP
jgi:hypothetical protein